MIVSFSGLKKYNEYFILTLLSRVDPLGNPVEIPNVEEPSDTVMITCLSKYTNDSNDADMFKWQIGDQPFSSTERKKVVIKKQPGRSVGLRIRGGKEFKLGIFIVRCERN